MKKTVIISLIGVLLIALTSCAKTTNTSSASPTGADDKTKEALIEIAASATDALTSRQYDEIIAMFDDTMTQALPIDKLDESWKSVAGNIGKLVKSNKGEYALVEKSDNVNVKCDFEEKSVSVRYVFDNDKKISGLWFGLIYSEPTPQETDKFSEEIIKVGYKEPKMYGLLTLPKEVKNPPVVILVHGSGQSDLNETIGEGKNQPFMDIAHGLAEQGIATIRYDKRYFAFPETIVANFSNITIQDEVLDDVNAAIKFAQGDKRLNKDEVFVLGHSLGGMMIPKIATDNPDLGGVISFAGTLRKIEDLMLDQTKAAAKNSGLTADEQKAQIEQMEAAVAQIKDVDNAGTDNIMGFPAAYWKSLEEIDGVKLSKELKMPMLILQGKADFQVYHKVDYKLWQDTLKGKDNVTFHDYANLNHLFMASDGKTDITEYAAKKTVDSNVINDIAKFINGKK